MAESMIGKLLVPACLVLLGATGTAGAQTSGDEKTDERLLECARIGDAARRMACYDDLARQVRPGEDRPPTPEAAAAPSVSGDAVSAEAPVSEPFAAPPPANSMPDENNDIRATIVRVERSGINHFVVQLDNGQVWEETDGSRRQRLPSEGSAVVIYEGRFGGYRMKIGDDNRIAWVRQLK